MLITGAACALPSEDRLLRRDLRIREGRIHSIAEHIEPEAGEERLGARGLELFPGAIDPHVHFDEPGFTQREDFYHGTMAAARGGVTMVIDMPCTSLPPVTDAAALKGKLSAVSPSAVVDYGFFGGVSGQSAGLDLAGAMRELAPNVLGFKGYFLSGMDSFPALNHYDFSRAIRLAQDLSRPFLLHAEDASYVLAATEAIKAKAAREGREADWGDYVDSRPEAAELAAVAQAAALAGNAGKNLHIVHVGSSAAALAAPGSCETCPHYLAFSREDFARLGSSLKTAPPVKALPERERLARLLGEGAIAFLASDHAPSTAADKRSGSVWTDYGGIPGTGTLFPYAYSELWRTGLLSLKAFLRAVSSGAAERYGLSERKGSLQPGKDADLILVDPSLSWTVRGADLLSKGIITPFEGMRFLGSVRQTMVRGKAVWKAAEAERLGEAHKGIVVEKGWGRFLRWGEA